MHGEGVLDLLKKGIETAKNLGSNIYQGLQKRIEPILGIKGSSDLRRLLEGHGNSKIKSIKICIVD